jgi:putative transposase
MAAAEAASATGEVMTKGKVGSHGGNVAVQRPRVCSYDGHEIELASWRAAQAEDWLGRWTINLMLISVST